MFFSDFFFLDVTLKEEKTLNLSVCTSTSNSEKYTVAKHAAGERQKKGGVEGLEAAQRRAQEVQEAPEVNRPDLPKKMGLALLVLLLRVNRALRKVHLEHRRRKLQT